MIRLGRGRVIPVSPLITKTTVGQFLTQLRSCVVILAQAELLESTTY
jgi:hypothetical protein